MTTDRTASVLHVDLDAFFVSMELLRHPELRGKPVAVGWSGNRGVISTCTYEARAFGVHSAMPSSQAKRLCPALVFLEPDFSYYHEASQTFHAILRDYTPVVEPAGADEAYLDVRGSERIRGTPREIAVSIRARVRDEIGITTSVGVSINKLVSKVASDAGKPDGLVVVEAGEEAGFLAPRPIRDLPGIGPRTADSLARLGVRTIGDLARLSAATLEARFGSHGADIRLRALGRFDSPVLSGHGTAKSISREVTFGDDESSQERLHAILLGQAERIAADLARQGRAGRTVTLKLRFPPFETLTRSATPGHGLELADEIAAAAIALFDRTWDANGRRPVRLIGAGVTNLQQRGRQLAFGEQPGRDVLEERLRGLRDRFGDTIVRRGAEIGDHTSRTP
ncbi:MAG TPA: DNA polymerase IV [Tepidiformaceae bacterium]|nr:DNA polymerase IV [Tepidiformaceae bacterium]